MMKYSEFVKTYSRTLKKYPEIERLWRATPENNIKLVKIEYEKSGSRWKEVKRTENMIDFIHYTNIIDAIPFFKNLGGYEKTECGYTKAGYLPIIQHSINPSRDRKSLYEFHI